jgi:hypothetical protein
MRNTVHQKYVRTNMARKPHIRKFDGTQPEYLEMFLFNCRYAALMDEPEIEASNRGNHEICERLKAQNQMAIVLENLVGQAKVWMNTEVTEQVRNTWAMFEKAILNQYLIGGAAEFEYTEDQLDLLDQVHQRPGESLRSYVDRCQSLFVQTGHNKAMSLFIAQHFFRGMADQATARDWREILRVISDCGRIRWESVYNVLAKNNFKPADTSVAKPLIDLLPNNGRKI